MGSVAERTQPDVVELPPEPEVLVRTSEPARLRMWSRLKELFAFREILGNLVRKELKVRYKSSVLGVMWSMLNPLLYLAVFYVVFTYILPNGIPDFAVYLLSGLIAWTLFATALQGAAGSVVANSALVTKVAFPREILPLSAIGASLNYFFFQFLVLLVAMVAFLYPFIGPALVLLPLSLVTLLLFSTALGFLVAGQNVRYRDTQHLVDLLLLAWFWVTPIVYPAGTVMERLQGHTFAGVDLFSVYLLNPMANIALGFQRALYGFHRTGDGLPILPSDGIAWYAGRLGIVAAVSLAVLLLTWRRYFRMSGDFAEEL